MELIVVNDGSAAAAEPFFTAVRELFHVYGRGIVIDHKENMGKGAAIKTAVEYCRKNEGFRNMVFASVDADGQHSIIDIIRILNVAEQGSAWIYACLLRFIGSSLCGFRRCTHLSEICRPGISHMAVQYIRIICADITVGNWEDDSETYVRNTLIFCEFSRTAESGISCINTTFATYYTTATQQSRKNTSHCIRSVVWL